MSDLGPHRSPTRLGDFVIVGVLGEGGSGTVFDARWGHREVALKVLKGEMTGGDRERFLAEARLLIEMTHPGVVKVLAAGSLPDGRPYLAMEKLPGESLARRLGRGPMPLPQAITLFAQLCDAVAAMHARALIHRDLKPENVMLVSGPTGEHAVLLDFGIAKLASDGVAVPTQSGLVRGTPAYMAPERFFGHPASISTDVYELAVTLFAMLAGRLPWADTVDPEVRLNPVRLSTVASVPQPLDELVARALSTRAPHRPPSVQALCDEAVAAAGQGGVVARSTAAVRADASGPVAIGPTVPSAPTPRASAFDAAPSPGGPWPSADRATTGQAASGERAVHTSRVRRRWPFAVGAALAAAAGAVAIVVASQGDPATKRLVTGPDDPWSGEGPRPVIVEVDAGSVVPDPLPPDERAQLRDELAGSLRYHAPDVEGMIGVGIAEMRRTKELARAVAGIGEQQIVAGLVDTLLGECDLAFGARADWVSLSLVGPPGVYDMVASGNWIREDIEGCVRGDTGTLARRGKDGALTVITDGAPVGDRTLGWIDDSTFFVSNRAEADVPFVTARLTRRPQPANRVHELAAGIDRRSSLWLVADRRSLARVMKDEALRGADLTARFALGEQDDKGEPGAGFQVAFYFADEDAARAGDAAVRAGLSELTESLAFELLMPEWPIRRDGTMVRVHGLIPDGALDKVQDKLVDNVR